jgi:hypothetical protein
MIRDKASTLTTKILLNRVGHRSLGGECQWVIPTKIGYDSYKITMSQSGKFKIYGDSQWYGPYGVLERLAELRPDLVPKFAEPIK